MITWAAGDDLLLFVWSPSAGNVRMMVARLIAAQRTRSLCMVHNCVGAILVHETRVLLGLRTATRSLAPGVWDVFGGHLEPGEHPEHALRRELAEELGIVPTRWSVLAMVQDQITTGPGAVPQRLVLTLYCVRAWSGTPRNRQRHEHARIGWFAGPTCCTGACAWRISPTDGRMYHKHTPGDLRIDRLWAVPATMAVTFGRGASSQLQRMFVSTMMCVGTLCVVALGTVVRIRQA